uniref:Putative secreted protein n=1 Tax=Ixodes ricinus TaxID=34613 RepID=A0A6B0U1G0_IXORI
MALVGQQACLLLLKECIQGMYLGSCKTRMQERIFHFITAGSPLIIVLQNRFIPFGLAVKCTIVCGHK